MTTHPWKREDGTAATVHQFEGDSSRLGAAVANLQVRRGHQRPRRPSAPVEVT